MVPTGPFIIDFILEDTPEKTQRDALEETLGVFPAGCQDLLDFTFQDTPEQALQAEKDTIGKTPAFISSLECWNWSVDVEMQKKNIPEHEKEGLCMILVCWFGIALKVMEAAAARFSNA